MPLLARRDARALNPRGASLPLLKAPCGTRNSGPKSKGESARPSQCNREGLYTTELHKDLRCAKEARATVESAVVSGQASIRAFAEQNSDEALRMSANTSADWHLSSALNDARNGYQELCAPGVLYRSARGPSRAQISENEEHKRGDGTERIKTRREQPKNCVRTC